MPISPSYSSSKSVPAPADSKKNGATKLFGVRLLPFSCGCRGSKAASASSPSPATTATATTSSSSSTATSSGTHALLRRHDSESLTSTTAASFPSPSPSHYPTLLLKQAPREDDDHSTPVGTPTISDLLRQLSDLEQAVMALDTRAAPPFAAAAPVDDQDRYPERAAPIGRSMSFATEPRAPRRTHRRSRSDGEGEAAPGPAVRRGTVAVETETADPVGDFRRSMMEVIAEEKILAGGAGSEDGVVVEERLRGLLRQFLALNHPTNHHYVVRAFALVLEEVCAPSSSSSSPPPSATTWVDGATAPTFSADLRQRPPIPRRVRY